MSSQKKDIECVGCGEAIAYLALHGVDLVSNMKSELIQTPGKNDEGLLELLHKLCN